MSFMIQQQKMEKKTDLASWAERQGVKDALLLNEEADPGLVSQVISEGYLENPTESDLLSMGQDPFLISYALADIKNRIVVTAETSKPSRQGANRHVPDVCDHFNIKWKKNFELIEILDFSTSWR